MVKNQLTKILIFVGLLIIVIIGGFFADRYFDEKQALNTEAKKQKSISFGKTDLINPTVTSNLNKHFIINFMPLRKDFEVIQQRYPQKTYVYFAYLNNSSWVGLGEKELFTAASTIKVPMAMTVYKMVEEKKLNLDERYELEQLDLNERFGDLYKEGAGTNLTVEELVKIMLEKSDNTAANALYKIMERLGVESPLDDVYAFMGWEFNEFGKKPDYEKINLKTLSNMFLSLYNASYVNIEHSQKILEYLANTPFDDKIVSGTPTAVPVAHKIGIATNKETFSDCGIVYAPNRNYLLCVGSNGGDEKQADAFMSEVSKVAYQYVMNN